jgi:hypothetical protein
MEYKGLVAENVQNISKALHQDLDCKLSFPGGVFSDCQVDEMNYLDSGVSKRNETDEELDDIHKERVSYLLNTDDALIELLK